MMNKRDVLHVVAAVIYDIKKEHILIAKRPDEKHQGGKWEFPGGKVEVGEEAQSALQRELSEELGIQVSVINPLIQIDHQYSDKSVFLDVYEVFQFTGEAFGKEGQEVRWVKLDELTTYAFPAANISILQTLGLDVARSSQ